MAPRVLHGLDRDVYQIVRRFEDQQAEEQSSSKKGPPRLTVAGVYDSIKRSNSSLARQKKRPLEDSIERMLRLRKEERLEEDEDLAMEEAVAAAANNESPKPKERDYFAMNKQITKSWNVARRARSPDEVPSTGATTSANEMPADLDSTSAAAPMERQANGEPKAKRRRAERKAEDRTPPTGVSLEDLGGIEVAKLKLVKSVAFPMLRRQACVKANLDPTRGVLLYGPPGCGKTMLANAFAAKLGLPYIPVSAPSLIVGVSGESEKKIRDLYEEAKKLAPCLVFIDEIDAVMGKRENAQREMEKRIVAQMLTCMDDLNPKNMDGKPVITIAATNRPDSIDAALRRAGRFNVEINIGMPNQDARESILRALLRENTLADDIDFKQLAKMTPGFVGADLKDMISIAKSDLVESMMSDLAAQVVGNMEVDAEEPTAPLPESERLFDALLTGPDEADSEEQFLLHMENLVGAIGKVQPSAKREGFTTIPDTTWADVGALKDVREELKLSIVEPIQHPEVFARFGLRKPEGVLLWGPPGCGKTLLAKAVANESKANFIAVKGPELLNKYVGESERSVRQVFTRARSSAPCILFFDELDALVPRRDDSGSDASSRVVNMLLTELDGMDSRAGIYIIGATNRPDMIDPAILRPGRLGTSIFVDLPDADGRVDILRTRIRTSLPDSTPAELEALEAVARDSRCEGFSGADLENLHVAAGRAAYQRLQNSGQLFNGDKSGISGGDWETALSKIKPSVSNSHSAKFRRLRETGWK